MARDKQVPGIAGAPVVINKRPDIAGTPEAERRIAESGLWLVLKSAQRASIYTFERQNAVEMFLHFRGTQHEMVRVYFSDLTFARAFLRAGRSAKNPIPTKIFVVDREHQAKLLTVEEYGEAA